jgi:glutamate-5-semialdehyde dehydrogenase
MRMMNNLEEALKKLQTVSQKLVLISEEKVNGILNSLADLLEKNITEIIKENAKDLEKIDKSEHVYDRILLNEERIKEIAESVRAISAYASPINVSLEEKTLDNGLKLNKVSAPIGVVGAIFEARPNVLIDTFSLCFKSRNACVMKGGSQAENSNIILAKLIIEASDLNTMLLLSNDRSLVAEFLKMDKYVDVIIPRGGQGLIDFVRENSSIPVIETGRGVCHTFVDESANTQMAKDIILNAKTTRPSVCNSLDTLLLHVSRLEDLKEIMRPLDDFGVKVLADDQSFSTLEGIYDKNKLLKADNASFGKEFLSLSMSVKVVEDVTKAIDHINTYGSKHSEAIITESEENAERFLAAVDAAAVYRNASIRFTDGAVFGLGAEVGISTQKLHARGPMGIKELCSYKWLVRGDGQIR